MGGYLLSTNKMSAGEVMAFLIASQTIQRSLAQVSLLFGSVVRGSAAGARVFEVFTNCLYRSSIAMDPPSHHQLTLVTWSSG